MERKYLLLVDGKGRSVSESRTERKRGTIPYLNSTELNARNTVKERKYPVLRPTVCAVEAYERFSFERKGEILRLNRELSFVIFN